MKKLLVYFMAIAMIGIFSCSKDDDVQVEKAGEIPGLGNAGGDVEIAQGFVLPEGVSFAGEIRGIGEPLAETSAALKTSSSGDSPDVQMGCFPMDISCLMLLNNENDEATTFTIPAGTIFEVINQQGEFQIGITLFNCVIELPANCFGFSVRINLFCANQGLSGSSSDCIYDAMGLTGSGLIMGFVDLISPYTPVLNIYKFLASGGTLQDASVISNEVQAALWKITNGVGLDTDERDDLIVFLTSYMP